MKKIKSISDSGKFEKTELRKIKGGLKATTTNRATNTPRRIGIGGGIGDGIGGGIGGGVGGGVDNNGGGGTLITTHDADDDSE